MGNCCSKKQEEDPMQSMGAAEATPSANAMALQGEENKPEDGGAEGGAWHAKGSWRSPCSSYTNFHQKASKFKIWE